MPDNRGKYTLDELLRAKREEKPDDAFWSAFDRNLKAKQRKLVQRRIVADDGSKSMFGARLYRFAAFGSAASFAAIALYVTVGTDSNGVAPQSTPHPTAIAPAPVPTFSVAESKAVAPVQKSVGLQEFATVAHSPKPRIVIERVNPAASVAVAAAAADSGPAASVETAAARPANYAANLDFNGLNLEFLNATGLFDDPITTVSEPDAHDIAGIPSFEQSYALGKYADPLGGTLRSSSNRYPGSVPVQAASFGEIDAFLSSQGDRGGSKSLDSVTLRF